MQKRGKGAVGLSAVIDNSQKEKKLPICEGPSHLLFPCRLTFAVAAHPPVAVFALALVRARRVEAGGVAAAASRLQRALVHV